MDSLVCLLTALTESIDFLEWRMVVTKGFRSPAHHLRRVYSGVWGQKLALEATERPSKLSFVARSHGIPGPSQHTDTCVAERGRMLSSARGWKLCSQDRGTGGRQVLRHRIACLLIFLFSPSLRWRRVDCWVAQSYRRLFVHIGGSELMGGPVRGIVDPVPKHGMPAEWTVHYLSINEH